MNGGAVGKVLLVGLGGFLGAVARYGVGSLVQARWGGLPWGTLVVNVVGCFLIGALSRLAEARGGFTDETRAFLVIGVLGGFTTFSAFGWDTLHLLEQRGAWFAGANVGAHLVLALGAVALGRALMSFVVD